MRLALLVLFIAAPLLELAVLIELGRQIGFWWTILIVVATAVIGTAVLQQQGIQTITKINLSMAEGVPPVGPVVEGFFLLIAGAFLLTPGIITDTIGFLLLVPPLRRTVAHWSLRTFMSNAHIHVRTTRSRSRPQGNAGRRGPHPHHGGGDGPIIEGEYERVDERTEPRPPHQDIPRKD
jgi:UPF0716 protein FxsA